MLGRLVPHPGLSAMLGIVWLLVVNSLTPGTLLMAAALAIALPLFTAPFWPARPRIRFGAGLVYLAIMLWDIVAANLAVARIILFRPGAQLRPQWLVIPIELDEPEAVAVLAGTISLTPGTVSADLSVDGRHLLVHALDAPDPEAEIDRIKRRYEARLKRIFA